MALIPTKKIPQLTAYGFPLAGSELLEIWSVNTSRRITTRDFPLPIDSLVTAVDQSAVLPGSRHLASSATVLVVDGGAGGPVTLESTFTGALAGNPTGTVGLAAVNGVALTWMRSDAAPPLSQAIAPTWSSKHIFAAVGDSGLLSALDLSSGLPQFNMIETDGAVDNRVWAQYVQSENLHFSVVNNAGTVSTDWALIMRTGTTVDSIGLTSTALTWNGSPIMTAGTAFANPTASIGLAAVNGVATTALRSDAAQALSQAIAPTWTGVHVFTAGTSPNTPSLRASSARPIFVWNETDAAADNRAWFADTQAEQFRLAVLNDAGSASTSFFTVDRTLNVVDTISLLAGSNTTTVTSSQVATNQQFRSTKDWALNNLLNYGLVVSSNNAALALQEADAAANNGIWDVAAIGEQLLFRTVADGVVSTVNWMTVDRTGTAVDVVTFPVPVTLSGTTLLSGATTLSGVTTISGATTISAYGVFTRAAVGGAVTDVSVALSSAAPILGFNETAAAANNRLWEVSAQGEAFLLRAYLDDGSSAGTALQVDRTGATVDQILFGATTLRFNTTTASTVGAAGGASALPATPSGYLAVNINGTAHKIPYYAN